MSNYNADADAYAQIEAEYKKIEKRLKDIKAKIYSYGVGDLVGEYYTVTYKLSEAPKTFDKDLAAAQMKEFGLTDEQIEAVFNCKSENAPRKLISYTATAPSTQELLAA